MLMNVDCGIFCFPVAIVSSAAPGREDDLDRREARLEGRHEDHVRARGRRVAANRGRQHHLRRQGEAAPELLARRLRPPEADQVSR